MFYPISLHQLIGSHYIVVQDCRFSGCKNITNRIYSFMFSKLEFFFFLFINEDDNPPQYCPYKVYHSFFFQPPPINK